MRRGLDRWLGAAAAAFLGLSGPAAFAADDAAALRAELDALKKEYESRIGELESRIRALEKPQPLSQSPAPASPAAAVQPAAPAGPAAAVVAAPAEPAAAPAEPTTQPSAADLASAAQALGLPAGGDVPPVPDAGAPVSPPRGGPSAFNPAISLILAGRYANESRDPATYRIAGVFPAGDAVGPGPRSFNLDESELTVAANVDPYFFASMTAAITGDNEISVEEAYFRTTALPSGFTLKGGRFFSGVGYLNEVHSHAWDFVDQPLIYQAFFDGQLAQDGAQLKWIAPLDTFLELGVETGDGRAFPGTKLDRNRLNGTALFAHLGGDIGDSTSWRLGTSWLEHRSEDRAYQDLNAAGVPVIDAFTGTSHTFGIDAILKWAPHGDVTRQQLKVQGEYMHRTESGTLAYDLTGLTMAGADLAGAYRGTASGWYVQAVYQFIPRWRAGLRYDALQTSTPTIGLVTTAILSPLDFPTLLHGSPDRTTVMMDWNPSEFTRIRVQYALDDARPDGRDREFFIQYLYGIGAHGAHKF